MIYATLGLCDEVSVGSRVGSWWNCYVEGEGGGVGGCGVGLLCRGLLC